MDFHIDPNAALADIQLACFIAAITALVELAKTTDKDHIKLRALTEVARLCKPAKRPTTDSTSPKPTLSPRRLGSPGFTPSPTPSSPAPTPPPHGTPSASDGPQAPAPSPATPSPDAPIPVAHSPGSDGSHILPPSSPSRSWCSTPTLNRRQRRFLARLEANERKHTSKKCAA